ncbi:MAG: hypothetical protein HOH33_01740 [Verrucomicrobia bacterium]|jgi:menaquinone-9 beta-reductase|nr:hypothetical protein [Verrucomicrobiota bacterium]
MSRREIHIVGGGVGGLVLGIRLRQLGVEVRLSEAGQYPRHRVCGEFISGKGVGILGEMDLLDAFKRSGAQLASTMKCYGNRSVSPILRLPESALCISRYTMDHIMSSQFENMGGNLLTGQRYPIDEAQIEGTILATGRQPTLKRRSAWIGYKFHLRGMELSADLEMHFTRNGYLGLCRVEKDSINVCGLYRANQGDGFDLKTDWKRFLSQNMHPERHQAISSAQIVADSLCFVSGLSYRAIQSRNVHPLACIGDRMATIPPLTGNGMSMALESACLASGHIVDYVRKDVSWSEVTKNLHRSQSHAFRSRLSLAVPLQRAIFSSNTNWLRESFIKRLNLFHKLIFALTR